jgi:hypothetical protein
MNTTAFWDTASCSFVEVSELLSASFIRAVMEAVGLITSESSVCLYVTTLDSFPEDCHAQYSTFS